MCIKSETPSLHSVPLSYVQKLTRGLSWSEAGLPIPQINLWILAALNWPLSPTISGMLVRQTSLSGVPSSTSEPQDGAKWPFP